MSRILLLANPIAGRGKVKSLLPIIEQAFRGHAMQVETFFTTLEGNENSVRSAIGQVDTVVAVGGDGTVNAVVRSLMSHGLAGNAEELPAIGIIPLGTGNATISAFGIPRRLSDAIDVVVKGQKRKVDVGVITRGGEISGAFFLWLGAGLPGVVMHKIHQTRKGPLGLRRLLAMAPAAFKGYFRYPFHEMVVEVNDQPSFICTSALIANVGCIPLLGEITAYPDPSDGQMEIITTSHARFFPWLKVLMAVRANRLDSLEGVNRLFGSRFRLSARGEVPVQIDGDASGFLPLEVTVRPGAIQLIVP
jgi:diacylglycerol kinase (ATP)